MNFQQLLHQRTTLLQRTRLANVAFVYHELGRFVDRIARGQLRGRVTLWLGDPAAGQSWPVLEALQGSQAVIDEHFVDRDVFELSELLLFQSTDKDVTAFTFRLEDLEGQFREPLRRELEEAGVVVEEDAQTTEG